MEPGVVGEGPAAAVTWAPDGSSTAVVAVPVSPGECRLVGGNATEPRKGPSHARRFVGSHPRGGRRGVLGGLLHLRRAQDGAGACLAAAARQRAPNLAERLRSRPLGRPEGPRARSPAHEGGRCGPRTRAASGGGQRTRQGLLRGVGGRVRTPDRPQVGGVPAQLRDAVSPLVVPPAATYAPSISPIATCPSRRRACPSRRRRSTKAIARSTLG